MSGHSKWSSIKHKKGKADARRGKIFTKLIKEITIAARLGGGDPGGNPRLRQAIIVAKENNMPADNINRAIKKGTGELPGTSYEEVTYEGYGPGGVAVLIEALTDNKNRTLAEIRYLFSKSSGNLGDTNCVAWLFELKGLLIFDLGERDEEELLEKSLELEVDDFKVENGVVEIHTSTETFEEIKEKFKAMDIELTFAEITKIPKTTVQLEGKKAEQMLKLMEKFEEHDDVQAVYANFDIDEKIMEQLEEE
ncbi:YebC/PmpR family DNA-binding transcriptional regulator [bacterium]|nr:YebC/PmpR family DNA-binding transcriptional regulator [bacterium]